MRQNNQGKLATSDEPLIAFTYGWGRTLRLYRDYLAIDNITYALSDLIHVKYLYQRIMGVESVRLTLRFRTCDVVLRGIADINAARKALAYIHVFCGESVVQPWRPGVHVPLRLPPDERVCYASTAAWCREPSNGRKQAGREVQDRGTLILTNRRVIYLGRLGQFVIDYAHLTHLLMLPDALALVSGSGTNTQRNLFALSSADECLSYLEALLILWQQQQSLQTPGAATEVAAALPYQTMRTSSTVAPAISTLSTTTCSDTPDGYQAPSTSPTPSTSSTYLHWTYASLQVPAFHQKSDRLMIDEVDTMPLSLQTDLWQVEEEQV
jgi:hypothetical protein